MTKQLSIFDAIASQKAKDEGMVLAEMGHAADLLAVARVVARELAARRADRRCDADAVGKELALRGYPANLGPAGGSLFKGGGWEFTGDRKRSARVSNHARELKIWRLM